MLENLARDKRSSLLRELIN